MKAVLAILLFLCLTLSKGDTTQSSTCSVCKQVISLVSTAIGNNINEQTIKTTLTTVCNLMGMDSYCTKEIYPNIVDIFWAIRSNKTSSIVCQRINLCQFKIISVTGEVLLAEQDKLEEVTLMNNTFTLQLFARVYHPELPTATISGFACSVNYCALILRGLDTTGSQRYGIAALSSSPSIHHLLDKGTWYGPWYDVNTDEFWMAQGTVSNLTFGILDPRYGEFLPKVKVYFPWMPADEKILSATIDNRILYFTCANDTKVYFIDLALRMYMGNFTTGLNSMLASNPVTNQVYGYTPSKDGIFRVNTDHSITTVAMSDFSGIQPVSAATIDPVRNLMWICLWGRRAPAWFAIDLNNPSNIHWRDVPPHQGLFSFNPYQIKTSEQ